MPKKNGNMYEWVGKTWNPIAGKCPHLCEYCYAQNFRYPVLQEKYSGPPRLVEHEFKRLKSDKPWFVCSCSDLFAKSIPQGWIIRILDHCKRQNNQYVLQSKNPKRIFTFLENLPSKSIIGTTVESNGRYAAMGKTPDPFERLRWVRIIGNSGFKTFVTIEPILDFNHDLFLSMLRFAQPDFINIGANTNHNVKLKEPRPKAKIKQLINSLGEFTEVRLKDNLKRLL